MGAGSWMVDLILTLIPGEWLAAVGAAIAALAALWFGGRRSANADAKAKLADVKAKQLERIADADLGLGASDADRIKRMRDFANKHSG